MTGDEQQYCAMHRYWFSCNKMTIQVNTDGLKYITWTAPIAHKFVGQRLENLEYWMTRFGGFEKVELV